VTVPNITIYLSVTSERTMMTLELSLPCYGLKDKVLIQTGMLHTCVQNTVKL